MDDAFTVGPLAPRTWVARSSISPSVTTVRRGGCWCTWSTPCIGEKTFDADDNRDLKERLVNKGRAHAALVFDGDEAMALVLQLRMPTGAAEYEARKEYEAELDCLPDYRLTCFFVDRRYRRRGISALALQGALDLIAKADGGVVEAYPQDTGGKKITASFLYSVTRSLFEQAGFSYVRPKGKNHTRHAQNRQNHAR